MSARILGLAALVLAAGVAAGCASPRRSCGACAGSAILYAPGAAGVGPYESSVRAGLSSGNEDRVVEIERWGAPLPIFVWNFSSRAVHEEAECGLAECIVARRRSDPAARIDLVGHSAGCGVILGALGRLPSDVRVGEVVLLAPSVSPGYDLGPALAHMSGHLHVFSSCCDTVLLKWRNEWFGGYDAVNTPAAGYGGFDPGAIPPADRERVVAHPYEAAWAALGHGGGHYGYLSAPFLAEIVAPLLRADGRAR